MLRLNVQLRCWLVIVRMVMVIVNVVHGVDFRQHVHHGDVKQCAYRDQHHESVAVVEPFHLDGILQDILFLCVETQKSKECR